MSFQWIEYMYLAQELVDNKDISGTVNEEAKYRSAISRAYYSVYCHIKDYITKKKKIPFYKLEKESDHQAVIRLLRNYTNGKDKKYADYLDTLRTIRNQADYDDNYVLNYPGASSLLSEARTAIDICNQIFGKFN